MTFLLDLGVERRDGKLQFEIEDGRFGSKRVVARFHFHRPRRMEIESQVFRFANGDTIQLFFSYRYTPDRVRNLLARYRLGVRDQWIAKSGEEGVFLCEREEPVWKGECVFVDQKPRYLGSALKTFMVSNTALMRGTS